MIDDDDADMRTWDAVGRTLRCLKPARFAKLLSIALEAVMSSPGAIAILERDVPEQLIAELRALHREDPEVYRAVVLLMSRQVGRRQHNKGERQ